MIELIDTPDRWTSEVQRSVFAPAAGLRSWLLISVVAGFIPSADFSRHTGTSINGGRPENELPKEVARR